MPLHLLGQKSWNVYSAQNQERVRRDEATARLKEEEEERRMQEADAERRMLELRRRQLIMSPSERQLSEQPGQSHIDNYANDKKIIMQRESGDAGGQNCDDSDQNARSIDRGTAESAPASAALVASRETVDRLVHESLLGKDGHINLFQDEGDSKKRRTKLSARDRNEEYEREKKEKDARIEAQFTSRLDNPAEELKPWYTTLNKVGEKQEKKTSKRLDWEKHRDEKFKAQNDPMAVMKRGLRDLKEVEDQRRWIERERKRDLDRLRIEDREMEDFRLDGGYSSSSRRRTSRDGTAHVRSRTSKDSGRRKHRREESANRSRSRSPSKDRRNKSSSCGDGQNRGSDHRKQRRRRSVTPERSRVKNNDTMEKLRAEKERRELLERQKAEATLTKIREDAAPGYKIASGGRYSAQFAHYSR